MTDARLVGTSGNDRQEFARCGGVPAMSMSGVAGPVFDAAAHPLGMLCSDCSKPFADGEEISNRLLEVWDPWDADVPFLGVTAGDPCFLTQPLCMSCAQPSPEA